MSTKRSRRREREKLKTNPAPEIKRQPRQRFFTEDFRIGETVAIIRHDHGWEDGGLIGRISSLSPTSCTVYVDEEDRRGEYYINHCRDIHKV